MPDARTAITDLIKSPSGTLICHYTTLSVGWMIVCSKALRLSPLRAVNDPREIHERRFESGDYVGDHPPVDADSHVEIINRRFLERTKLFCGTRDTYSNEPERLIDRGFGHPRMWAQYGGNHAGVCLVFDKSSLIAEFNKSLGAHGEVLEDDVCYERWAMDAGEAAFQIDYDDYKEMDLEPWWKKHVDQFKAAMFFRKHEDWRGECEWRYVHLDGDADGPIYAGYGDSLKYIIGGCHVVTEDLLALSEITHVPTLRLSFDPPMNEFLLTPLS